MTEAAVATERPVDASGAPAVVDGFRAVRFLAGARLRMVANGAVKGSAEQRLVAALALLIGAFVGAVLARLASVYPEGFEAAPADQAPVVAGLLGVLAGFTLVTAVPFALTSLYVARDVQALHVAPIRPRAILLARLLDQLGTGAALCLVLAGPPAAVYLLRIGRLEWLPWCGLVVLGMAALPLAAGALLTILVVRVVPARRVRDAAGAVISLAIVAVTGANLLLRGPAGVTGVPGSFDLARSGGTASTAWLPTGWAARSCAAVLRGDTPAALDWGLPLIVAGPLALAALARIAEPMYGVGFRRG
ncbi:MAG TPA: hypothetical protein VFO60_05190, partial [Candidatus Dormibacteraeota bacterium]|nr:hypothetical protein [Candidatus Dormibacteraeota bacterium]